MRSVEKWEELNKQAIPINEKIAKYESNKIAPRKTALSDLYVEKRKVKEQMDACCPHDKSYVFKGSYTDQGYGCDRHYYHYDIYCARCDRNLTYQTDTWKPTHAAGPFDFKTAVEDFIQKEHPSEDLLRKIDVTVHRKTTTTITTEIAC